MTETDVSDSATSDAFIMLKIKYNLTLI